MIRSMTAFARSSASILGANWAVEIKSINHRFFEFSLKVPSSLNGFEAQMREVTQADVKRGKVMVMIGHEGEEDKAKQVVLHEPTVKIYMAAIAKLKKQFKLAGEVSVSDIIKLPGVLTVEPSEDVTDKLWKGLEKLLKQAVKQLVKSKEIEGAKLAEDIFARLEAIEKAVEKAAKLSKSEPDRIYKKLKERIETLLGENDKDNNDRVMREVAFLAERSDITEEIVRLGSHISLFRTRLKQDGEAGRELDFLCQEMNREINTIGSKSQLFDIAKEVVFVKGELEKIREQIQNIE